MDTTLKQRLIGAVVLVALAVIFLPMLVQGPAPDSGVADVSMRVPDAPAGQYETRELPLLAPPAATGAGGPAAAAEPVAADSADAGNAGNAGVEPSDAATAAGQWAVSFGAYASARDAEAVLERLRQAGLPGLSETATLNGRQAWRVRVGPYPDRALAEAGRLQAVRIRSDVNAQVIALDAAGAAAPAHTPARPPQVAPAAPPSRSEGAAAASAAAQRPAPATAPSGDAPAPSRSSAPSPPAAARASTPPASVPAPAAQSVGFAVQMGAFASAAEAGRLRDRLRAGGHSAIVQPVRTDKGALNRVRVGPVSSRAEAEQLKARLAAGGFGSGMVVSHP